MVLCNSPYIFQENIFEPFVGLDTVLVYIDEILHVTKVSWTENITVLKDMFNHLQKSGIKVNSSKSFFGARKFEYLVYHVTRDGIMPIRKKVNAIQDLLIPKTCKHCVSL